MKNPVRLFFPLFLFVAHLINAQPVLPYKINGSALPSDTTRIAQPKTSGGISPGMFVQNGFQEGDIVPDFTLFDTTGKACQLSQLLAEGKPVLLIAVSFTCPQSRKSVIDPLRRVDKAYGKKINIRLIYTIEAHPNAPDICPYTGNVFTTANNINDSVLFLQSKTYLERKKMAEEFVRHLSVKIPILIDDPDNDYWKTFGPAPNNAYLITPGGAVFKKYPWLEESNGRITGDIPELLSDTALMKTNFRNEVWIGKSTYSSHTTLFVAGGKHYSVSVVGADGKVIFKKENIPTMEFDLEKMPVKQGEYSLLIKNIEGHSWCVHYSRP